MISVGIDVSKGKSTRVKTDKQDSITIANYGIDSWFRIENHSGTEEVYSELKLLGR